MQLADNEEFYIYSPPSHKFFLRSGRPMHKLVPYFVNTFVLIVEIIHLNDHSE